MSSSTGASRPRRIAAAIHGDLEGTAVLDLDGDDHETFVHAAWTIEMMQAPMRLAARIGHPLLRWGHDRVVDATVDGFRRHLSDEADLLDEPRADEGQRERHHRPGQRTQRVLEWCEQHALVQAPHRTVLQDDGAVDPRDSPPQRTSRRTQRSLCKREPDRGHRRHDRRELESGRLAAT